MTNNGMTVCDRFLFLLSRDYKLIQPAYLIIGTGEAFHEKLYVEQGQPVLFLNGYDETCCDTLWVR